ncbi:MAG TPA: polyphosphate kinase 1 [Chloroflexia bacterium]|nr:polyphosphate kinase 1 [Chloroflexia bacterium]
MTVEPILSKETAKDSPKDGAPAMVWPPSVLDPAMYINREISLLDYNARVLEEAQDARNPLLERLKFCAIVAGMLDEFFMIRVSGIREQVAAGITERSPDGMTPAEEIAAIRRRGIPLLAAQSATFAEQLQPALAEQGIVIADYAALTGAQHDALREYFDRVVFPITTPLAVDPGHPFPHISNLSLNLAVELQDPDGQQHFARVKVPNVIPRLVAVPPSDGQDGRGRPAVYAWLDQVLAANLGALFPQMQLLTIHPFRVIRDADLEIQELEADDLLETVERSLSRRRFGEAVALFLNPAMPAHLRRLLTANLELDESDVYTVAGPMGLSDLMELTRLNRPDLKYPMFTPRVPPVLHPGGDLFHAIQQNDILLHHPFDSFNAIVDFIRTAAMDPHVLAIKQTLYRVGSNSPIIEALLQAAEAGKQVAVLMELKARWDEENNIESARALEHVGVHVTYGLIGLKTHCKIALVVRKEEDSIRRYVHLGTGNYNPSTARSYTDLGLLTARPDFGADASELFNYLTGYSKQAKYRKLLVAPLTLRTGLLALIEREIARQREHGDGRLIFKMNGLVDPALIETLYRASQAGVAIDLLVRGVCCLRPGVPGLSDHIRVTSIIGRFLEHSRLYYFGKGGKGELLMGSADLMPRNLDHRVETLFPVEDENLRNFIVNDVLELYLRDTVKARILQPDGMYTRATASDLLPPYDVQAALVERVTSDPEVVFPLSALPKKYRKYLTKYGRVDPQE